MSQSMLESRLKFEYEKQTDCPIPLFEKFMQNLTTELTDIINENSADDTVENVEMLFTETGFIVGNTVYCCLDEENECVKYKFLGDISTGNDTVKLACGIFNNINKVTALVMRYCDFLNKNSSVNADVPYIVVDKVLKFLTDKNNIGKTCKFRLPLDERIYELKSVAKLTEVVLRLTIKTSYLIEFEIQNFFNKNEKTYYEDLVKGEVSTNNIETFIKELYYNGRLVNYGR